MSTQKTRKNGIWFGMFLLLIFTLTFPNTIFAEDSAKISMELSSSKTIYYTGEQATVNLEVLISSDSEAILNPTIVIEIPKQYVLTAPTASDLSTATSKTVVQDGVTGNHIITYTFASLPGGTILTIPILVSTTGGVTPDNYVLNIDASLKDESGVVVQSADQLNLVQNVAQPTLTKGVLTNGSTYQSQDGTIQFGGSTVDNVLLAESQAKKPKNFTVFGHMLTSFNAFTPIGA